jgi:hypothetical protein
VTDPRVIAPWLPQAAQLNGQGEGGNRRPATGGKRRANTVAAANRPTRWTGIVEPQRWSYDGGLRREPVLDTDFSPPRVVRKVGWRSCMRCKQPFFSEDVIALRLCDGPDGCRDTPFYVDRVSKPLCAKENGRPA